MPRLTVRASVCCLLLIVGAARSASAQTCVRIDESSDMLTPDERTAAALLVRKQFEQAGYRFAGSDCQTTYTISHIRLGRTIVVTLSGPTGSREGKALGLDDLPAVYSQLVRSLITGEPMGSLAVLDRTNVSAAQDRAPRRVQSDGYWHARVGYAALFGPTTDHMGSFGFGYRVAFDRLGLDMSFLNLQMGNGGSYYDTGSSTISLIKLEGLYFTSPNANRSAYFGGGVSYGRTDIRRSSTADYYPTTGHGSGLQGELTVGYEIARVTSARVFAQADVTLPFYNVEFETFSYAPEPPPSTRYVPPTVTIERQYAPSVTLSIGLGWQRGRR